MKVYFLIVENLIKFYLGYFLNFSIYKTFKKLRKLYNIRRNHIYEEFDFGYIMLVEEILNIIFF